jgi:hypothetical protein
MVVVRTFHSAIEAEMALSALTAAGFHAMITKDDCGGAQPSMNLIGGIDILVPQDELDAATELLTAPAFDVEADQDAAE